MVNKNKILILKVIFYINKILNYANEISKDDFIENQMLVEACVFSLLQIGELAGKFDERFKDRNVNIPWNKIRGLRNRLVHDYDGVDISLVWDIIANDLKSLKIQFEKISS